MVARAHGCPRQHSTHSSILARVSHSSVPISTSLQPSVLQDIAMNQQDFSHFSAQPLLNKPRVCAFESRWLPHFASRAERWIKLGQPISAWRHFEDSNGPAGLPFFLIALDCGLANLRAAILPGGEARVQFSPLSRIKRVESREPQYHRPNPREDCPGRPDT